MPFTRLFEFMALIALARCARTSDPGMIQASAPPGVGFDLVGGAARLIVADVKHAAFHHEQRWVSVWSQSHKSMLAFARALRVSPLGRQPTIPSRPQGREQPMGCYDQMRTRRGRR